MMPFLNPEFYTFQISYESRFFFIRAEICWKILLNFNFKWILCDYISSFIVSVSFRHDRTWILSSTCLQIIVNSRSHATRHTPGHPTSINRNQRVCDNCTIVSFMTKITIFCIIKTCILFKIFLFYIIWDIKRH